MENNEPLQHEYPLGVLVAFGPDAERATKYMATLIPSPDAAPTKVERWYIANGDIRDDANIAEEVEEFFTAVKAAGRSVPEGIKGCPHDEGIDYPLGGICRECKYWATIERTRRTSVGSPAPKTQLEHISAQAIAAALSEFRGFPSKAALASADARREELTPILLAALETGLSAPLDATPEEARLFSNALYLFAKWREPLALPYVIRWLSLPETGADDIGGDIVTHDGPRILAAVAGRDLPEIRALVENTEADDFCRGVALQSLAVLMTWDEMPRETLIAYLRELISDKLIRGYDHVWTALALLVMELEAKELLPLLRAPFDADWIDQSFVEWDELENPFFEDDASPLELFRKQNQPIKNVAHATEWWSEYYLEDADDKPLVQQPATNLHRGLSRTPSLWSARPLCRMSHPQKSAATTSARAAAGRNTKSAAGKTRNCSSRV